MNELQRLYEVEKAAKLLRFSAERDNWPIVEHGRFRSLCAALDGLVYDEDAEVTVQGKPADEVKP